MGVLRKCENCRFRIHLIAIKWTGCLRCGQTIDCIFYDSKIQRLILWLKQWYIHSNMYLLLLKLRWSKFLLVINLTAKLNEQHVEMLLKVENGLVWIGPTFLNLGTIDIVNWTIFSRGAGHVQQMRFSIPAQYPLEISSISTYCHLFPVEQNCPCLRTIVLENFFFRPIYVS